MITVYSHINGISLNGRQYLLDDFGELRRFRDEQEVRELFLLKEEESLEDYGIYTEEEDEVA